MIQVSYYGITDKGLKREINQDSVLMHEDPAHGFYLFAVADGMGGHADGEVASRMITDGLKKRAETLFYQDDENAEEDPVTLELPAMDGDNTAPDDDTSTLDLSGSKKERNLSFQDIGVLLKKELIRINGMIYSQLNQKQICGSTAVVMYLYDNAFGVLNAGDSRIYRLEGFKAKSVMVDDVWENRNAEALTMDKKAIQNHPYKGRLVNAVGTTKEVKVYFHAEELRNREAFLLCSDGLYKYCPMHLIDSVMRKSRSKALEQLLQQMLNRVYEAGAKDNVTMVLVHCSR
jgi:protein phosphatase